MAITILKRIAQIYFKYGEFIQQVIPLQNDEGYLKFKIIFIDNSSLRIIEEWEEHKLQDYSYYWLDEKDNLIMGWDTASHHKKIPTFPHHKHTSKGKILPSKEKSLKDVLNFITANLKKNI